MKIVLLLILLLSAEYTNQFSTQHNFDQIEKQNTLSLNQSYNEQELSAEDGELISIIEIFYKDIHNSAINIDDIKKIIKFLAELLDILNLTAEQALDIIYGFIASVEIQNKFGDDCSGNLSLLITDLQQAYKYYINKQWLKLSTLGIKMKALFSNKVQPQCLDFVNKLIPDLQNAYKNTGISNLWWGSEVLFNLLYNVQQCFEAKDFYNGGYNLGSVINLEINGVQW
ncbi:hypothetical protein PPERSA_10804 [Pseudocohnilembus persalinus]|uniref:Transmembrane protein n=1 Tax=Pseudocohnilembus persalinus TaxID=266149 RepID=A0A0V0QDN5_PSEPJ|nr:hypothetical protein PPERSA_10804 [Pseudocohnilembus persalinus]|eukprot:KRX00305.1 hypothetical protein PPERSA_10804 [Pseudocohnilembus persalinus]